MRFVQIKHIGTSFVLAIFVTLSSGMGASVSAMSIGSMEAMDHESTNITNCINQHHVSPDLLQKVKTYEAQDDNDEPWPHRDPYFVVFQKCIPSSQELTPKDIARSSSYKPPDIVRLTMNVRF